MSNDRNSGEDGPAEGAAAETSESSAARAAATPSSQEGPRQEGNRRGTEKLLQHSVLCSGYRFGYTSIIQPHPLSPLKKGRKSNRSTKVLESSPSQRVSANKNITADVPKLRSQYGVDSWKRWIQWRQTQPDLEKPRFGCKSGVSTHLHQSSQHVRMCFIFQWSHRENETISDQINEPLTLRSPIDKSDSYFT